MEEISRGELIAMINADQVKAFKKNCSLIWVNL